MKANKINQPITFGVNFSRYKAEYWGLDWKKTYLEILDDLKVKHLRLSAYWTEIENKPGIFDFKNLDWQINEAEKRGVKIILAIGWRLPGWPECHTPDWAKNLSKEEREEKILNLLEKTIKHYKTYSSIWAWQVENEPFLKKFGICPEPDRNFFEKEIKLVKSLDNRPIIVTASGELSNWFKEAYYGDILGVTLYRVVYSELFKTYFKYFYPPFFYNVKKKLVNLFIGPKEIIVTELQAEPWIKGGLKEIEIKEHFKTMNLNRFRSILKFIRKTKFNKFYFWGVEWWFWLKNQGYPLIWEEAKKIFES
jgi:hypothetical protein